MGDLQELGVKKKEAKRASVLQDNYFCARDSSLPSCWGFSELTIAVKKREVSATEDSGQYCTGFSSS